MKKVLLTGFDPFGSDKINPSLELIKEFTGKEIAGTKIVTSKLPVVFGKAIDEFKKIVKETKPILILSLGQAGKRDAISIEKVGINLSDARIADNEGNKPLDEPIILEGPAAYFTTINVRKTYEKIKEAGIPVQISYSAGTYVCNNLTYGALHFLHTENLAETIKYGFIHIPYLPSQAAEKPMPPPSMSLELIKRAIEIAIVTNLELP